MAGAPGQTAGQGAGLPGMIGSMFNSFFGGGQAEAPPTAQAQETPQPASDPAGGVPPIMQAGMDSLFKMFQPGVAGQAGQPGNLADMIGASLNQRR